MDAIPSVAALAEKVIQGGSITRDEALGLAAIQDRDILKLFAGATRVREALRPPRVDLCSIVSAKTGACSEDCSYCAQSASSDRPVKYVPLIELNEVERRARVARDAGAARFCIVTSGKKPTKAELASICRMIGIVREAGLKPCATLGLLSLEELKLLRDAGLMRYHHNLETSRSYFPEVCTTHSYDDKLRTASAAQEAGLSLCSGGIFGLGESWGDRIDMAMELRALGADSVPINFLVPVPGTPLGLRERLTPLEALKIISVMRFLLPVREVRVCGGRLQTLGELNSLVLMAGADGLLTGDCLTVAGRDPGDDLRLIESYGLEH